jgi:aminoglycoside phosphotransferase (APT) family kinase protein
MSVSEPIVADHPTLPLTVADLTPEWLTAALGTAVVEHLEVARIIPGTATKVLLRVVYAERPSDGPPTRLCVKGAFDPAPPDLGAATAYQAEVDFYSRLAPGLGIPLPHCWYAHREREQRQGVLVLDDLAATGHAFGDPTEPFTPDQVSVALEVLATLHAATAGASRERFPWAPFSPVRQVAHAFLTRDYWDAHLDGPDCPPVPDALRDRDSVVAAFGALWSLDDEATSAISHGDPHVGNTYLDADGRPAFLDWHGVCLGPPMDDVAYLIGGALSVEDRQQEERDLLEHYLAAVAAADGPAPDFDEAWLGYRRHHLHGFLWSLTGPRMQPRADVLAMSERYVAAILDHDTLDLLTDD